jgi:hypothetical protein
MGDLGAYNPYIRPDPTVFTFDLIGDYYNAGINANAYLLSMLEGAGVPAAMAPAKPRGLSYDRCNYATLLPMKMGRARDARPVGFYTHKYKAYWLPWSHYGMEELHLDDQNINFFFTAMFSGCTFAVATPAGPDGAKQVYVTHIAWHPGPNIPQAWGGGHLHRWLRRLIRLQ